MHFRTIRNNLVVYPGSIDYFKTFYARTHDNIPSYFYGVIAGLLYFNFRSSKKKLQKLLWIKISWILSVLVLLLIIWTNSLFYLNDYEKPSVNLAILGGIFKHGWGIAVSVFILGFIFIDFSFAEKLINHEIFRIVGRISFSTFMCHLAVIKIYMSEMAHQPIYLSRITVVRFKMANVAFILRIISFCFAAFSFNVLLYFKFSNWFHFDTHCGYATTKNRNNLEILIK